MSSELSQPVSLQRLLSLYMIDEGWQPSRTTAPPPVMSGAIPTIAGLFRSAGAGLVHLSFDVAGCFLCFSFDARCKLLRSQVKLQECPPSRTVPKAMLINSKSKIKDEENARIAGSIDDDPADMLSGLVVATGALSCIGLCSCCLLHS
ncbi:hypothetical protein PP1Y_Lpl1244 (plasmid) [Novosphingobium sp. PP1Y]|nr:hypothetical protein PP1Y_Lpl1244 [Novosphingobium sp. PP1Y]